MTRIVFMVTVFLWYLFFSPMDIIEFWVEVFV